MRAVSKWFMASAFIAYAYLLFVVLSNPFSAIEKLTSSEFGWLFLIHQSAIDSAIAGRFKPVEVELTALKLFGLAFYIPFTLVLVVMWRLRARLFFIESIPKDLGRVALFVVVSFSLSFTTLLNPSFALFGISGIESGPKPWGLPMFLVLTFFAGYMQIMAVEFVIRYLEMNRTER